MAASNASPRGQRLAILASPLHELTGFALAVDCGNLLCGGERAYAITAKSACYGGDKTVAAMLRQMRCARGCGRAVAAAWLVTGPELNHRIVPRRVPLLGPETRG